MTTRDDNVKFLRASARRAWAERNLSVGMELERIAAAQAAWAEGKTCEQCDHPAGGHLVESPHGCRDCPCPGLRVTKP